MYIMTLGIQHKLEHGWYFESSDFIDTEVFLLGNPSMYLIYQYI